MWVWRRVFKYRAERGRKKEEEGAGHYRGPAAYGHCQGNPNIGRSDSVKCSIHVAIEISVGHNVNLSASEVGLQEGKKARFG